MEVSKSHLPDADVTPLSMRVADVSFMIATTGCAYQKLTLEREKLARTMITVETAEARCPAQKLQALPMALPLPVLLRHAAQLDRP